MRLFLGLIVSFFLLSLGGCATEGVYLDEVNRNLQDIRTAIRNLYGIQTVSENERIIVTQPLKKDPNDNTPAKQMKVRVYARIVIVGDQRPFRVHVQVYEERKLNGKWVELDIDERLSKDFAREINQELINSLDNRNVIDDFRAF